MSGKATRACRVLAPWLASRALWSQDDVRVSPGPVLGYVSCSVECKRTGARAHFEALADYVLAHDDDGPLLGGIARRLRACLEDDRRALAQAEVQRKAKP